MSTGDDQSVKRVTEAIDGALLALIGRPEDDWLDTVSRIETLRTALREAESALGLLRAERIHAAWKSGIRRRDIAHALDIGEARVAQLITVGRAAASQSGPTPEPAAPAKRARRQPRPAETGQVIK